MTMATCKIQNTKLSTYAANSFQFLGYWTSEFRPVITSIGLFPIAYFHRRKPWFRY